MGLTATSLPVGEDGRVVTCEAPKDQVSGANLIDVLLVRLLIKDAVVSEFCSPDLKLVIFWMTLNNVAFVATFSELAADHGPDTHRYFH